MRRGLLVAATLAAGCTLLDGRPRVTVEAATLPFVGATFELTVRVRGEGRIAQVLVDGRVQAEVRANEPQSVVMAGVADGPHRLRARLVDAPYPAESEEVEVQVDRRPPTLVATPAPGPILGSAPPTITLHLADDGSGLGEVTATLDCQGCATVDRPAPDTVRIQLLDRLDEVPGLRTFLSLHVEVLARDRAGNRLHAFASYQGLPLGLGFDSQPPPPLAGVVTLSGPVLAGLIPPEVVELRSGGRLLGSGPVQGDRWSVTWDTRQLPDGVAAVALRSPNRQPGDPRDVRVDNTPPVIQGCRAMPDSLAQSVRGEVGLLVSENVHPVVVAPEALVDGAPVRAHWSSAGVCLTFPSEVSVPSTLELPFPAGTFADDAGNQAAPLTCRLELATWVAPAGRSPVRAAVDECAATMVAAGGCSGTSLGPQVFVGDVPGPGGAGAVFGDDLLPLNVEPSSAASDLQVDGGYLAWLERASGGPGHVYARPEGLPVAGPLNADPLRDATEPSGDRFALAWAEETAAGGRTIRVHAPAGFPAGGLPLTEDPAAEARAPAISWPAVAWVERSAGGPAQLRAKVTDGLTWTPLGGPSLNADPAQSASAPAIIQLPDSLRERFALVWVEGGRLLLREWDGAAWGAPQDVGADPLLSARAPRFSRGFEQFDVRLIFVQEVAGGEEVRFRRWRGGGWSLLPGGAGTLPPGAVRRAWASGHAPLAVCWTDTARQVHVRMFNE